MNSQVRLPIAAALVGMLVLTGCSNHLTRSKVTSTLKENYQLSGPGFEGRSLLLGTGRIAGDCYVPDSKYDHFDPVGSDYRHEYKALVQTGFITVTPVGKGVWNVALTDTGQHAIKGDPYGHTVKANCDSWQVTLPLSTFDSLRVDGILEDGPHAKVDVSVTWKVTPLGQALKQHAAQVKLDQLGTRVLLGDNIARMTEGATEYRSYEHFMFDKYDDGWKIRY